MMKKFCYALDLVDDDQLINQYEQWHQPESAWPAITQSIKDAGITDMEIYRVGNRLFMVMETTDDFNPELKALHDAQNPIVQQWETLMWQYQQPLPWAKPNEKWTELKRIFKL